jgi:hypothetical protein
VANNKKMSGKAIELILTELGADISSKAKETLKIGGQTILSDAKARIHSISGTLSASGKIEVNKKGNVVKIVFDAKSPVTATSEGGYGYSKIIEFRPGHEHPYLYVAYDAQRDKIKQNVIETIRQAVQKHAVP